MQITNRRPLRMRSSFQLTTPKITVKHSIRTYRWERNPQVKCPPRNACRPRTARYASNSSKTTTMSVNCNAITISTNHALTNGLPIVEDNVHSANGIALTSNLQLGTVAAAQTIPRRLLGLQSLASTPDIQPAVVGKLKRRCLISDSSLVVVLKLLCPLHKLFTLVYISYSQIKSYHYSYAHAPVTPPPDKTR